MSGHPQQLDSKKVVKPVGSTANRQDGHREVVFSVTPGAKKFWLKLQDSRHTWNNIPLGTVSSASRGAHPKGANVLVPVLPLCYTTPDADPRQAAAPRPGWLYVYRNGRLWRELEIAQSGCLRDVNLKYSLDRDVREATGYFDTRVLLPYKVAGEVQTMEMAYSEVQWSRARIEQLEQDAALRTQRMQEIDLSGYGTRFEPKLPEANRARVENVTHAPQLYHLALHRKSNIPVIYLHDPLGVAQGLAGELFACLQDYLGEKAQAMAEADTKYNMADMIHQMALKSADVAQYVDLDEIRNLLRLDEQERKLRVAENAAIALGQYLNREVTPEHPDINIAMRDYEEQSDPERLLAGYSLTGELVEHLALGEGAKYLNFCLRAEDHFLHRALNPTAEKLEKLVQFDVNALARFIESLAGSTQTDEGARILVYTFFKRVVEHFSSDSHTLASANVDLGPVLAGAMSQGAQGGYLHHSYLHVVRTRIDVEQWVVVDKANPGALQATLGRSVDWLRNHQQLVKANAIRLFAVLEAINLGHAVRDTTKTANIKSSAQTIGHTFNLISLGVQYLKDVHNIGAGWDDNALSKAKRDALHLKRIKVTVCTHGPAFIGNVIALALAWNEAWGQYKRGDVGAATAGTVSALGTTIMSAAATLDGVVEMHHLKTRGFQGARMAQAAQWGGGKVQLARLGKGIRVTRATGGTLIGLAVGLAGALLAFCFYKSPLQQFLIHGPFGREKSRRYTGDEEYAHWKNDEIAEATLFNFLFSPGIEPRFIRRNWRGESDLELRIHLPLLIEDKTRVDFELYGSITGSWQSKDKQLIVKSGAPIAEKKPDGAFVLKVFYSTESLKGYFPYQARVLLDLYGDGKKVVPSKIENGRLLGTQAIVLEFPEALQS